MKLTVHCNDQDFPLAFQAGNRVIIIQTRYSSDLLYSPTGTSYHPFLVAKVTDSPLGFVARVRDVTTKHVDDLTYGSTPDMIHYDNTWFVRLPVCPDFATLINHLTEPRQVHALFMTHDKAYVIVTRTVAGPAERDVRCYIVKNKKVRWIEATNVLRLIRGLSTNHGFLDLEANTWGGEPLIRLNPRMRTITETDGWVQISAT